jgi:hypothetical protein
MFSRTLGYLARFALVLGVLGIGFVTDTDAQRYDKKTTMTINQPFQIPGTALPAGTYVIKLVDVAGHRTVVRFMDSEERKVYATLLGISDYKLKTPETSEFSFYESEAGVPRPLRAWFYPGDNYGVEFVYPKSKAIEIAKATGEHVLAESVPAPPEPEVTDLLKEPVAAIEPGGREVAIDQVHPEPTVPAPAAAEAPVERPMETLPKTALPFAMAGLAGLLAAGMAGAVRVVRKRL